MKIELIEEVESKQEICGAQKSTTKPNMNTQPKEITEAASGKGDRHGTPLHAGVSEEATDMNDRPRTNSLNTVDEHHFQNQYHQMMSQLKVPEDPDSSHEDVEFFDEEEDLKQCNEWINMYGKFTPPVPKYLIVKDAGRRQFSGENVLKRTAWVGRLLNIRDTKKVPEMRRLEIQNANGEKVKVIAITADSQEQAKFLLRVKRIGPCKVAVDRDERKNTINGVLFDYDRYFSEMSNEEMEQILASEGVIKVQKIGMEASRSYKLLFNMLSLPDRVKTLADSRSFPIRDYIPPPLRCYRCQKYDHANSSCRQKNYTCQRCGGVHQNKVYAKERTSEGKLILVTECKADKFCIHCKQDHEAGSVDCPQQVAHVEVNKLMVLQKISRFEAKSRVFSQSARSDAKVITNAIRLQESEQELEKKKKEDEERKVEIQSLNNKLDRFMAKVEDVWPNHNRVDVPERALEVKIQKAVEAAVLVMKEENDKKFQQLQSQLTKQTKTITDLTKKNHSLEEDNKKLREQLIQKDKALSDEMKKSRIIKPPSPVLSAEQSVQQKRKNDGSKGDRNTKTATGDNRQALIQQASSTPQTRPQTFQTTPVKKEIDKANQVNVNRSTRS